MPKKIHTALAAVAAAMTFAADADAQAFDPAAFYDAVSERLQLTDEQAPFVEAAFMAHGERVQELRRARETGSMRPPEMFRAIQESRRQLDADLAEVLDEAQLAELEVARRELRAKARERRSQRPPGQR